jgi:uncharacterized repeat protein (TIGR03803 family)
VLGGDGNFYGTTSSGGGPEFVGNGTVFEITPSGTETVLYSFGANLNDGASPNGLVQGSDGNFYGTTLYGGRQDSGTVFEITPTGTETVLYSFGAIVNDGIQPFGLLVQGSDGDLYGTTIGGGSQDFGTFFKITPSGTLTLLYSFGTNSNDGVNPRGLIQGRDGNFYGTTIGGGMERQGTVFQITPSGTETVLYSFGAHRKDGNDSDALVQGDDGNFYGTTAGGGRQDDGTVFKIDSTGNETILYSFGANPNNGPTPSCLVKGSDGNFYGTTFFQDSKANGTIFEITPSGTETVLYRFDSHSNTIVNPIGLAQGSDGNFYGTIQYGLQGLVGGGAIFKLTLPRTVETLVVAKGDAPAGISASGAEFDELGPPAIDQAGDVAFKATLKFHPPRNTASQDSGIWLYAADGSGKLIVQTGNHTNPAPGIGGTTVVLLSDPELSDPVLSSAGDVAFIGSFAAAGGKRSRAIFVQQSGGSLTVVAQTGDVAPGVVQQGAEFASFEQLAVESGGGVAFLATILGPGVSAKTDRGFWASDTGKTIRLVAQNGALVPLPGAESGDSILALTALKPLPNVQGQGRSLDTIGGNLRFLAKAKTPGESILASPTGSGAFSPLNVVNVGSTEPNTSYSITYLDEPIVNENGSFAFLATLAGVDAQTNQRLTSANNTGIGLVTASFTGLAVQTGVTMAPDRTGSTSAGSVFSELSDPVLNDNDAYAFIGMLESRVGDTAANGSNDSGIWTNINGPLACVVRKGDAAPGTNGAFASFEQLVLPDVGGPIFTARLQGVPASQSHGLWAVNSSDNLVLLIATGNTRSVHGATKTVKSFRIFELPKAVSGQSRSFDGPKENIIYTAEFTDGTSAIFEVLGP